MVNRMKVRIWNIDAKPYRMEFDMPETDGLFPHLKITNRYTGVKDVKDMAIMLRVRAMWPDYTGGMLSSITLRQGPIVDLFLSEENMTLKEQERGKGEKVLMSSEGIPGKGLFAKLLSPEEVKGGVRLRVTSNRAKDVLETVIPESEAHGFRLQYQNTNIVSMHAKTGPLLDVFLMDGSLWLVDDENTLTCIMSTERKFDVDRNRFAYFDEPPF